MKISTITISNFLFQFNTPISFLFFKQNKNNNNLLLLLIISINYSILNLNEVHTYSSLIYKKKWFKNNVRSLSLKNVRQAYIFNFSNSNTELFNDYSCSLINYNSHGLIINLLKNFKNFIYKSPYPILSFTKPLSKIFNFILLLNKFFFLKLFLSINILWFVTKINFTIIPTFLMKTSSLSYFNIRSNFINLLTFNTKVI